MAEDNLENNIESDASSFIDDIKNTEDQVDPSVGRIASFVEGRFSKAEDARQNDETRWLQAYRNYRGLYGPDVQFTDTERSRVFVKVTKTKTLAAYGQVVEVLFGNNKFPLSVDPTSLPEGVAESVHFNTDPNAEKGIDEIKKAFSKWRAKYITSETRITIIGCTSEPEEGSKKEFKKFFDKNIFFPFPDYTTRRLMWRQFIETNHGKIKSDFPLSTLAHISAGYSAGSI